MSKKLSIIILAGGKGTRVKSVLGDNPKILAPIKDKFFLDYMLLWLERSFKDMTVDLILSLKKKKLKLSKLKDINYFSEPAAEKVKSSWYMKKIN